MYFITKVVEVSLERNGRYTVEARSEIPKSNESLGAPTPPIASESMDMASPVDMA